MIRRTIIMGSKISILLINDYIEPHWWAEIFTRDIFEFIKELYHINSFSGNLSASIFFAIPKKKKIIIHVHDFGRLCPKRWITYDSEVCPWWLFHPNCMRIVDRWFILNIIYDGFKRVKFMFDKTMIKLYWDLFICNSHEIAKYFTKYSGISSKKIVVLPNFTTIPDNHTIQLQYKDAKTFLFVWRLIPEKWVDILIYAVNYLVNILNLRDICLNIIGNGPQRVELESLVKHLQLENNIVFLGRKIQKDLAYFYQQAICTVVPSMYFEAFGLVNIESMKYGTPVIGSNIWWIKDIIEDNKDGYLFTLGDHIDLANKMLVFYNNKVLSIQMWKCWFEKVLRDYSQDIYYKRLLNMYKDIIST